MEKKTKRKVTHLGRRRLVFHKALGEYAKGREGREGREITLLSSPVICEHGLKILPFAPKNRQAPAGATQFITYSVFLARPFSFTRATSFESVLLS